MKSAPNIGEKRVISPVDVRLNQANLFFWPTKAIKFEEEDRKEAEEAGPESFKERFVEEGRRRSAHMACNQILRSDLQVLLDKYREIRDVSEEPYLLCPLVKADILIDIIDTFDRSIALISDILD